VEDYRLELRNDADLYVPFARTALIERQPLTKFPKTWHEFSNENIKIQRNMLIFNAELKEYFLAKLNANYRCVRRFAHTATPLTDFSLLTRFSILYKKKLLFKTYASVHSFS
jgi:hypothetical protein